MTIAAAAGLALRRYGQDIVDLGARTARQLETAVRRKSFGQPVCTGLQFAGITEAVRLLLCLGDVLEDGTRRERSDDRVGVEQGRRSGVDQAPQLRLQVRGVRGVVEDLVADLGVQPRVGEVVPESGLECSLGAIVELPAKRPADS